QNGINLKSIDQPSQLGVAFAGFFSVGARSFRANATPLQTHFGGDDSHPLFICQQYVDNRPYIP
ncbi:MAG: hypothetical protein D6728_19755, partial [Cyanobacteria bacterium J055]